jgi:hypothetical protein
VYFLLHKQKNRSFQGKILLFCIQWCRSLGDGAIQPLGHHTNPLIAGSLYSGDVVLSSLRTARMPERTRAMLPAAGCTYNFTALNKADTRTTSFMPLVFAYSLFGFALVCMAATPHFLCACEIAPFKTDHSVSPCYL